MDSFCVLLAPGCELLSARQRESISHVVVHRIEVSQEDSSYADTPTDVARFFREHPIGRRATGGDMPYPLLIDSGGLVTQCVPLGRITPHVRSYNPISIGIGVLGDFRARPPAPLQVLALTQLCAQLLAELNLKSDNLFGHDELSGASSDPAKECPGRHLSLATLRREVARALASIGPAQRQPPFVW